MTVARYIYNDIKRIFGRYIQNKDQNFIHPLLNKNEIVELLTRVQNIKKTSSHRHETSQDKVGEYRSVYRGHGMDYEESRRYQPGDDPRHMNWQLTARTGHHYMKVYREERQPGVFILVDRRQSMRFGTQQRLKITQAVRTAAITAFSAQEHNLSIGGVILDKQVKWFKESQNKQAIFDFISQASVPAPPIYNDKNKIRLSDILPTLDSILKKGSILYLISDFSDINEINQAVLLKLSSSHQVYAVQITDPAEISLPPVKALTISSVGNKSVTINTEIKANKENYQSASEDYYEKIKKTFEDMGITYLQILTTKNNIEQSTLLNI